jgi:hypothetical protein
VVRAVLTAHPSDSIPSHVTSSLDRNRLELCSCQPGKRQTSATKRLRTIKVFQVGNGRFLLVLLLLSLSVEVFTLAACPRATAHHLIQVTRSRRLISEVRLFASQSIKPVVDSTVSVAAICLIPNTCLDEIRERASGHAQVAGARPSPASCRISHPQAHLVAVATSTGG